MRGKGTVVKIKKRKVDSDKSMHIVKDDSPTPPIVVPFESLTSELWILKELVTRLLQRSSDSSSGPVSYFLQSEFHAYLKDQRKQKAQLANLDKAYASLTKEHDELSISHSKIKKWEKSRDKFFTRMWKGVKVLWKVLKVNEPLSTSKPKEDRDDPAT
ncbi:hypothetical protein KY290_005270 [Solanum tuberosum]|uniref:Uncharacterized protein n=1 Tax=Solanum tuberosum TaxID=4113 RepID=A0ABQ7WFG3_SOLTU|nr:hypothetical protein KY289_005664 [Solanum tuberosum]KAH0778843.1 hypothetical protein KY290_005270 [Solanum tuberosum]